MILKVVFETLGILKVLRGIIAALTRYDFHGIHGCPSFPRVKNRH